MEKNFRSRNLTRQRFVGAIKGSGRFHLFWLLAALMCSVALPALAEKELPGEIIDRIVAVVNDDIILLSDAEKAVAPYAEQIKERRLPDETEKMMLSRARKDIIDNLINEKLTTQRASELNIMIDEKEVDATLEQMKRSMLYSEEAFNDFLTETGYTLDDYRQQIKNQILKNKVLKHEIKSKIVVTNEEIDDYYQKRQDEFATGTQYHLKHIIMQVPKNADSSVKEGVRKKMEEIHRQIKDGAPFESMALQYSQSSFASVGGDLGLFAGADLSDKLKDAIINTKEGEITPVIETDMGYQIFYVQSIIENDDGLNEEVSEKIREELYNKKLDEKFSAWIKDLRDSAHIKIIQ